MDIEKIYVVGKNGEPLAAIKMLCSECSGDQFHVIHVEGHQHLECSNPICRKTVCHEPSSSITKPTAICK